VSTDPVSFGPFTLSRTQRLLTRSGKPVELSARALDLLILLLDRAGEVVDKQELLQRVWSDVVVDEGALRFHMSGLRKAIGDGKEGLRYIETVPGRGYCFVAPVERSAVPPPVASLAPPSLPARLARMVGRDADASALINKIEESRFATVVGPGGIGKTTVAVAVAHDLLARFRGEVRLADLSSLTGPSPVAMAVAAAVGLSAHTTDLEPALLAFLRGKSMLLILDGCDRVIDAAAALAERLCATAPGISILATSREPLGAAGELVHQLLPLERPEHGPPATAAEFVRFPAVQLFVERAAAGGARLSFSAEEISTIDEICARLDGVPLAIELAASRVPAFGLAGTAALLDDRLHELVNGRRTALPRHQTLGATLDWSYELLWPGQRAALRRLSVFVGSFSLSAARAVADVEAVEEILAQLVAKSLLTAELGGPETRYRLLDTARTYLCGKLREAGEENPTARRHALYYLHALQQASAGPRQQASIPAPLPSRSDLGNLRAALAWSFGETGEPALGNALAAAAAPLLVEMSLLSEAGHWAERALGQPDESTSGTKLEIELQMALAQALMFTEANSDRVAGALGRGLEVARTLGEPLHELRLLASLHLFHVRAADHLPALAVAEAAEVVAQRLANAAAIAAAEACTGLSSHLIGNHRLARAKLRSALARTEDWPKTIRFGMDYRIPAQMCLARELWIEGKPDEARALAEHTIADAEALGRPVTLCVALILGIKLQVWIGDTARAAAWTTRLIADARTHSLTPYEAVGLGFEGEQSIIAGAGAAGIERIETALGMLRTAKYELVTTNLLTSFAVGRSQLGDHGAALAATDAALARVHKNGEHMQMPEILRARGEMLARAAPENVLEAEHCLRSAIAWADRQSAPAWQLKAAISLTELLATQGRPADAREELAAACGKLGDGSGSRDLAAAKAVLRSLRGARPAGAE
jgi:predicted ATPase/DNA-binding winged helix-turn-helix (wHTH) protein